MEYNVNHKKIHQYVIIHSPEHLFLSIAGWYIFCTFNLLGAGFRYWYLIKYQNILTTMLLFLLSPL